MTKEQQEKYNNEAAAINNGEVVLDPKKEVDKLIQCMFDALLVPLYSRTFVMVLPFCALSL